jgi:hypothetical protein
MSEHTKPLSRTDEFSQALVDAKVPKLARGEHWYDHATKLEVEIEGLHAHIKQLERKHDAEINRLGRIIKNCFIVNADYNSQSGWVRASINIDPRAIRSLPDTLAYLGEVLGTKLRKAIGA